MPTLKILSYNIHKGFSSTNLKFILSRLKASIELVHADLVFLQEVIGHNEKHGRTIEDWPKVSQFEFLADKLWPHFTYGKNAIYTQGHHGNAILSKYPITFSENIDVSTNRLESRGLLHAVADVSGIPIHLICLHLGLFEAGREIQVDKLAERIEKIVPKDSPLIVGGDFNDWRQRISKPLRERLKLDEVFLKSMGQHAKTFPSWMPTFKLDRIYFRGTELVTATTFTDGIWSDLSDHVAICAEFNV
jgi:endonuclease/exonuclease/phosphatase family metal-dependent hydrolase